MNNTLIVGSGRGLFFAHLLQSDRFQQMNCRVTGVVEINSNLHARLRMNLDRNGMADTRIFDSLAGALEALPYDQAQSVMVVSPNRTHADCASEVLAAGRHLLLEKPIAADWIDVCRIQRLSQNTDRVIQLGFVLRYSDFYRKIHSIVTSGALGHIVMIQSNERLSFDHSSAYRRGWRRYTRDTGGIMNEKCSHDLDIINWLKKDQAVPVEVYSVGGQELFPAYPEKPELCAECHDQTCVFRRDLNSLKNNPYAMSANLESYRKCIFHSDSDVLTNQSVTIRFSDGTQAIFSIMLYAGCDEQRDLRIMGTEGHLIGDLGHGRIELKCYRKNTHEIFECTGGMHGGGDSEILADFFDCIANHRQPEATVEDGLLASQIAFAANLSVEECRPIKLDEFF